MAWTAPRTWTDGELITKAIMDPHVRDNLKVAGGRGTLHVHTGTTDLEVWYPCGGPVSKATLGTSNVTVDTLYAIPFFPRLGTADRIAFEVTTAFAANARVGLYASKSDTNAYPGALLVDGGSISTSTTGVKSATISTSLADRLCWAVIVASSASPVFRSGLQSTFAPLLGLPSTMGTALQAVLSVAFTFAALPSTFPASATVNASSDIPIIAVRYST